MRSIFFVVLFVILVVALPARARLGETEDQCIARYGTPTEILDADKAQVPYRTLNFIKGNYNVGAAFIDGHCECLCIQRTDNSDLSDNEIQILLDANSDGHTWKKSTETSVYHQWLRDDGTLAHYDTDRHMLALMSKVFIANMAAKQKAAEAQKLNGF